MSDSWTIGPYIFAELELKSIHGSPGLGFYRFIIRVDYTMHSKPSGQEVTVTNIGGAMEVRGKDTSVPFLGYVRREAPESPLMTYEHTNKGNFRDSVGACRDVMESLSKALSDDQYQLDEVVKSWFKATRSMGKEERLRLIRRAVTVLTHPARHADEVSASIEWGPMDARAVIVMAATLLQLAAGEK